MMNFVCEQHAPIILAEIVLLHTGTFSRDQFWQNLAVIILLHREGLHLEKTGLFQLQLYGLSALYKLQHSLLMADVLLRAPDQSVLMNHRKNNIRHAMSVYEN